MPEGYIESMMVASERRKAHVAVVQDSAQHALVQVHIPDVFCVDSVDVLGDDSMAFLDLVVRDRIAGSYGVVEKDGQLQDRAGQKRRDRQRRRPRPPGSQKSIQKVKVRMPAIGPIGQGGQNATIPK